MSQLLYLLLLPPYSLLRRLAVVIQTITAIGGPMWGSVKAIHPICWLIAVIAAKVSANPPPSLTLNLKIPQRKNSKIGFLYSLPMNLEH